MDKFEQQFENMDVQASAMEEAMSSTTTLTIPEVRFEIRVSIRLFIIQLNFLLALYRLLDFD